MGAYENPQAVIDTGTPQILANAIGNLGKQAAGVLDQEKEKRIAAEKVRKDWLKYTFEFSMNEYDKVHKQMIENGATTAAAFNSLNPLISQSTAARISAAKADSSEEQTAYLKQANENQTKISQFLSGEKQMNEEKGGFAEKMGANPGLAGKEGGIPMAGKDDKAYIYSMSVMSNLNKGKFTKEYNSKTKEYDITVTSDSIKNDPDFEGDSITMPESELIGYDLGTLTKIKANQQKLIRPSDPDNNPDGLGIYNSEGTLAAKYIDKNKPAEYVYSTVNGVKMRMMSYLGNNELIDADLTPALKIKAMGLLANPTQAQKDWENTILPNLTKEQLEATDAEGNKIFSDEILKGKLGFGSNSQGNDNIFDTASNAAFVKAYVDSGLAQVTRTTEKYPIEVVPKDPPPPKGASEPQIKRKDIQEDVDNAYRALFVDKIFEKDYKDAKGNVVKDEQGNVAKLGGATINSIGESGMTEQLQKLGLKVQKTETAGEGENIIKRYKILSAKIPDFYEEIRTDETLNEVVNKLYNATGLNYQGIIDPAKAKLSKLK
tara:strand:+ start:1215 stop:2855 length:1641 start_codon:yes stop_codon:yes gene_type:complete